MGVFLTRGNFLLPLQCQAAFLLELFLAKAALVYTSLVSRRIQQSNLKSPEAQIVAGQESRRAAACGCPSPQRGTSICGRGPVERRGEALPFDSACFVSSFSREGNVGTGHVAFKACMCLQRFTLPYGPTADRPPDSNPTARKREASHRSCHTQLAKTGFHENRFRYHDITVFDIKISQARCLFFNFRKKRGLAHGFCCARSKK